MPYENFHYSESKLDDYEHDVDYPAHIDIIGNYMNDYAVTDSSEARQQKHLEELGYNSDFIAGYMYHKAALDKLHLKKSLYQSMGIQALGNLMGNYEPQFIDEHKEPSFGIEPPTMIDEKWAGKYLSPHLQQPVRAVDPRREQANAEATYDIAIEPLDPEAELTPDEIIERMEIDHAVKQPLRLKDLVKDKSRKNRISYKRPVRDKRGYIIKEERVSMTEHQMLVGLNKFLDSVGKYSESAHPDFRTSIAQRAKSIQENLTFIGRKEYKEAVRGIATYWKALLDRNPDQQILVLAGEIAKRYESSGNNRVKSDEYLLDNILAQFSDEDAEKYRGRLITDIQDITATDADNLRIVLLDDWTISGAQMGTVAQSLMEELPRFKKSIEVQLVTANRERVTRGLEITDTSSRFEEYGKIKIPVRTYYQAYESTFGTYGAHISGFHSSVDYDFENTISAIVGDLSYKNARPKSLRNLPPLTNIVRPYRTSRYKLSQKDRFRRK